MRTGARFRIVEITTLQVGKALAAEHFNDTPPGEACLVSGRGKCFAWHKNQTESTEKRHSAELTSGYVHFRNIGISVCKSNQCGEI